MIGSVSISQVAAGAVRQAGANDARPAGASSAARDGQTVLRPDEADGDLTPEQQAAVAKMAARDREVREHEQAHAVVGGPYAGAPSYEYAVGPDKNLYAIGGEVPIDVAPVRDDPEATVAKMTVVEAAALAPPEPSATDRAVAALARAQRLQALAEMQAERREALSVRL